MLPATKCSALLWEHEAKITRSKNDDRQQRFFAFVSNNIVSSREARQSPMINMAGMIYTYHCICSQLSLAMRDRLDGLSKRQLDSAAIATTTDTILDDKLLTEQTAIILRIEDGFEKRYLAKCSRCDATVGYRLDKTQYDSTTTISGAREDLLYILPNALVSTDEMLARKSSSQM